MPKPLPRSSLLVRCTEEEAAAIREAAKQERRTISSFIMHSVIGRIEHQKKIEECPPQPHSSAIPGVLAAVRQQGRKGPSQTNPVANVCSSCAICCMF